MGPIFQRVWFLVRPNCLVMKVGALTYSRFSFKFPRLIHTFEQCFSITLMYVLDHCAPIHLQQVMYNLGHWQRLANKKLSWEDKHHTINGSTLLHLAIHGHGRSTVPDSTTADIQKAITCPGQLEISPIKAATHGAQLDNFGFLSLNLRTEESVPRWSPTFQYNFTKTFLSLRGKGHFSVDRARRWC